MSIAPSTPRVSTHSLVDSLLAEQQQTTAVEKFAQQHEQAEDHLLSGQYRDLIPLTKPNPGEQYAFEVDLDACSGCKACVAACHNLNGLDESEQWRSVGLLQGTTEQTPVLQHVTTACHHCIEPACMEGCPVLAYDKDPVTGIVRHLDDQCFGCQYCILMCPYEVPQYSASRGIVRKCDMCHDRLAVGEAPACVQSCPNQAIAIRTVNVEAVIADCETNQFLPTAPEPEITLPTTAYKSEKPLPRNALPADYFSANKQHSHMALVVMLVLTQLSVGAFVIGQLVLNSEAADPALMASIRPAYAIAGLMVGLIGMNAAVLHLGRPQYAFRAFLGLRTSWLSREILAFGVFAGFASASVATLLLARERESLLPLADFLEFMTALSGIFAVFCSVMIYVKTQRPLWNAPQTGSKFFLTSIVLGLPIALLVSLIACRFNEALSISAVMQSYGQSLCRWLIIAVSVKLAVESSVLLWLKARRLTPMKRAAMLLTGELRKVQFSRFAVAIVGGLLLPYMLMSQEPTASWDPTTLGFTVSMMTVLLLLGELMERYLFFAASVAPRMPGAAGQ